MNRIALTIIVGLLLPTPSAASWSLAPCSDEHVANWKAYERALRSAAPGSLHYLPRPFPETSQEVVEDFVYQYLRTWDPSGTPPEGSSIVFPRLENALARVKADFGIAGSTPQYVTVFSIPRMCEAFAPCIAFRSGPDTYVRSYRGDLFRVPASARRLSTQRELKRPDKMAEAVAALGLRVDEGVMSLGGSLWAVVRKVERGRHP